MTFPFQNKRLAPQTTPSPSNKTLLPVCSVSANQAVPGIEAIVCIPVSMDDTDPIFRRMRDFEIKNTQFLYAFPAHALLGIARMASPTMCMPDSEIARFGALSSLLCPVAHRVS